MRRPRLSTRYGSESVVSETRPQIRTRAPRRNGQRCVQDGPADIVVQEMHPVRASVRHGGGGVRLGLVVDRRVEAEFSRETGASTPLWTPAVRIVAPPPPAAPVRSPPAPQHLLADLLSSEAHRLTIEPRRSAYLSRTKSAGVRTARRFTRSATKSPARLTETRSHAALLRARYVVTFQIRSSFTSLPRRRWSV
jgi:hypothetical protein